MPLWCSYEGAIQMMKKFGLGLGLKNGSRFFFDAIIRKLLLFQTFLLNVGNIESKLKLKLSLLNRPLGLLLNHVKVEPGRVAATDADATCNVSPTPSHM